MFTDWQLDESPAGSAVGAGHTKVVAVVAAAAELEMTALVDEAAIGKSLDDTIVEVPRLEVLGMAGEDVEEGGLTDEIVEGDAVIVMVVGGRLLVLRAVLVIVDGFPVTVTVGTILLCVASTVVVVV